MNGDPKRPVLPALICVLAVGVFAGPAALAQEARRLVGHAREVHSLCFAPDGKVLASTGLDRDVILWDVTSGEVRKRIGVGEYHGLPCIAFMPDGKTIVVGSMGGPVDLWDVGTGTRKRAIAGREQGKARRLAVAPDGRHIAWTSFFGGLKIWDEATGQVRVFEDLSKGTSYVAFCPDGATLVCSLDRTNAVVLEVATGRLKRPLPGVSPGGMDTSAAFAPDGKTFAAGRRMGGTDLGVVVMDVETGHRVRLLKNERDTISHVAFTPDGKVLATAALTTMITLWDAKTGEELATLGERPERGAGHVEDLAMSPDGTMVATTSGHKDFAVRLWDISRFTSKQAPREPQSENKLDGPPEASPPAGQTELSAMRTWASADGRYTVEARLVGLRGSVVLLHKRDGRVVRVPIDQLSRADQAFVARMKSRDGFSPKGDANSPSKTEDGSSPPSRSGPSKLPDSSAEDPLRPDLRSARVVPVVSPGPWRVPVGVTAAPPVNLPGPIQVPPRRAFFERATVLAANPACPRIAIGYEQDFVTEAPKARVLLCDLASDKSVSSEQVPVTMSLLALSDDGQHVLMRPTVPRFGENDRLELWAVEAGRVRVVKQWLPYDKEGLPSEDEAWMGRDVEWAAFVAGDRLLTLSDRGKLALWDLSDVQPVYQLQIAPPSTPALSPDRKHLVFGAVLNEGAFPSHTERVVGVLDVAKGEVVALKRFPYAIGDIGDFAVSPSGARFACRTAVTLFVWRLEDGEVLADIPSSDLHAGGDLLFPDEEYVLFGRRTLVSIECQAPIWQYRGIDALAMRDDVCYFLADAIETQPGLLLAHHIPHEAASHAIQGAMQESDFFVLKPGEKVKLSVEGVEDAARREAIRKTLSWKLQQAGFSVADGAPVELQAGTETGSKRKVCYRGLATSMSRVYEVQEFFARLRFVYQDKKLWVREASSVPGSITREENQTIDGFLKESEEPPCELFDRVELPSALVKPERGHEVLGTTRVSVTGLR